MRATMNPRGMPAVFVSYRRADDPYAATLIYDLLKDRFGEASVFLTLILYRQASTSANTFGVRSKTAMSC